MPNWKQLRCKIGILLTTLYSTTYCSLLWKAKRDYYSLLWKAKRDDYSILWKAKRDYYSLLWKAKRDYYLLLYCGKLKAVQTEVCTLTHIFTQ